MGERRDRVSPWPDWDPCFVMVFGSVAGPIFRQIIDLLCKYSGKNETRALTSKKSSQERLLNKYTECKQYAGVFATFWFTSPDWLSVLIPFANRFMRPSPFSGIQNPRIPIQWEVIDRWEGITRISWKWKVTFHLRFLCFKIWEKQNFQN